MTRVNGEWVPCKEMAYKKKCKRGRPPLQGLKLTVEDVIQIRKLGALHVKEYGGDGSMTSISLSKMFPVSRQVISLILKGKAWVFPEGQEDLSKEAIKKVRARRYSRKCREKKKRTEEQETSNAEQMEASSSDPQPSET